MKLSSTLLALTLLPMLAPLSAPAQDKDKSDKAVDKAEKSVEKQDKAADKAIDKALSPDTHSYRLTYTLTEMEAGKKVGEQHFAMLLNPGSRQGAIRIGSKVPVATGSYSSGASVGTQVQFTYFDVGLTINATINAVPNGVQISSSVDQSSLGEAPAANAGQPVIRSTSLTSTVTLAPGGHVQLGSLDIPGSAHHVDVELNVDRIN